MPAGSPIGSGQGVLNPNNIRICLEYLKENDPEYPVIVDAGVGTASDVSFAMELGCDGVSAQYGYRGRPRSVHDGRGHALACIAGRKAFLAGRIAKKLYATASSPETGTISPSAQWNRAGSPRGPGVRQRGADALHQILYAGQGGRSGRAIFLW